jgi:hypothetical protein
MAYAKYIFVLLAMLIATSVMGCAQVYGDGFFADQAREKEIIIIEPDEETEYC